MDKKVWTQKEINKILKQKAENFFEDRSVKIEPFLLKCAIGLYNRQTRIEKENEVTTFNNNVGFNKPDGHKVAAIVATILTKQFTTRNQMFCIAKRIVKYSAQITDISNNENEVNIIKNQFKKIK